MNKKRIFRASTWVIVALGLTQIIRFASNVVLTRLLEPEVFGIMALVFSIMAGFAMFTDVGLNSFVIRHKSGLKRRILNCVWKIKVLRGWSILGLASLVSLVLFCLQLNGFIDNKNVLGNDSLPIILILVSLATLISSYQSLAKPILIKKMISGPMELVELSSQIFIAIVTIILAFFFRNVWAIVIGLLIASTFKLILMNKLFSFKHEYKWDSETRAEVINFGKWIFLASIITFLANQGDKVILSTSVSASELGFYSISFLFIEAGLVIIRTFVSKIWLPVFSQTVHKTPEKLKNKYDKVRFFQDIPILFAATFLFIFSHQIISLIYDDRYADVGWILQIQSPIIIAVAMTTVGLECLSALGHTKIRTQIILIQAMVLFFGLPLSLMYYGFEEAMWVITISYFAPLPVLYYVLYKKNLLSLWVEWRFLPVIGVFYLFLNFLCERLA